VTARADEERMSIHAWMLTGLLLGAPPEIPADAAPVPRLEKGLEITWSGTFSEAIRRPNVGAVRRYEIETRLFVLDVFEQGADGALLTSIKLKLDQKTIPVPLPIVRLELVRIDPSGKMSLLPADSLRSAPDKRLPVPLPLMAMEGLPTFEPAEFIHFPTDRVRFAQAWSAPEPKRPVLNYRIEGFEIIRSKKFDFRCVKVAMAQQTEDWNKLRSETTAWRRGETVWVSAKHGYAVRIERTIEKRDPKSGDLSFRSELKYDLVGLMRYPDRFGQDRRDEIAGAASFLADFERALADPARNGAAPFEVLLRRIEQHLTTHFSGDEAPYRQAILSVQRKAEAAKRGDIPPAPPPPETSEAPRLAIGKPALDIMAVDLTNREAIALGKLRGRPVLLIYYQPDKARTAEPVMRFAQSLFAQYAGKAFVLALAIGDGDKALRQRSDWGLTMHILAGRDVYKQHGIDSTPCFVVIDEEGIVRNITLGWSEENVELVRDELGKWVK
jgi:hypothetical protein